MSIQWFPGHMNKARKDVAEMLPNIDVIIEVLDARIPYSSQNPMVAKLRGNKPCIKIFNKVDLADPEKTPLWQEYYEQQQGVKTMTLCAEDSGKVQYITTLVKKMLPRKVENDQVILAMIVGIPNVGKSTLVNTLTGRQVAKTGNEPAVTKGQQRIRLDDYVSLIDTPGMLWPKVESEDSGYRLAITGAIKNTAYDYEDIAYYAADFFIEHYPEEFVQRYNLDELPASNSEAIEALARKRGCAGKGGRVNYHKASELLINELRAGQLGPLTFETPEMVAKEEIMVAEQIAAKEVMKEAKKAERKKRARKNR